MASNIETLPQNFAVILSSDLSTSKCNQFIFVWNSHNSFVRHVFQSAFCPCLALLWPWPLTSKSNQLISVPNCTCYLLIWRNSWKQFVRPHVNITHAWIDKTDRFNKTNLSTVHAMKYLAILSNVNWGQTKEIGRRYVVLDFFSLRGNFLRRRLLGAHSTNCIHNRWLIFICE